MKKVVSFLFLLLTILFSYPVIADQNETMTVEVNVIAELIPQDTISIEVPDYVFLGSINEGDSTDKAKIYVNNTGTVDVTITPQLVNQNDEIFQNLYFQNRQTGNNSIIHQIGDYSFNIAKPSAINGKRAEYMYMWLDLATYNKDIIEDLLGKKTDILFIATPQV